MELFEIENLEIPELRPYFKLTEKGLRHDGIIMVESPKVIERALDAGVEPLSLLCEKKHIEGDASEILRRCPGMPVFTGEREMLEKLTGYTLTRGVLCAMKRPPAVSSGCILESAKRICVVHDVCDSTNIGIIFRTAAALGYDGIILSEGSCDPLNRRSIRVSMGAVFQIPWAFETDIMSTLSQNGFLTVTTALTPDSVSLVDFKVNPDGKYAVILGSEGYGLPEKIMLGSDYKVRIPMHHGVDSLNVGAAAAIVLWHFVMTPSR